MATRQDADSGTAHKSWKGPCEQMLQCLSFKGWGTEGQIAAGLTYPRSLLGKCPCAVSALLLQIDPRSLCGGQFLFADF